MAGARAACTDTWQSREIILNHHERVRGLHGGLGGLRPHPRSHRGRDHPRLPCRRRRRPALLAARARRRMRDGKLCGRPPPPRGRHRRGRSQPLDARSRPREARPRTGMPGWPPRSGDRGAALRGRALRRGDGEPGAPPSSRLVARRTATTAPGARRDRARPPARAARRSSTPAPTSSSGAAGGTRPSSRTRWRRCASVMRTPAC